MVVTVIALLTAATVVAAVVWIARNGRGLLDERLGGIEERLERRLSDIDLKVDRRLEGLDGRLLMTERTAGERATQIVERLGKLDSAAAHMLQRANDLARLEQALRPPKARGGVGEILLGKLLADCLPPDAYNLQFTFRSGERVDAVVRTGDKLLPIDAKFPLDNFERVVNAEGDAERELHERAFARDVKHHVDAIASKYVRPAEGTFDFAFMYLPSEAVYYELVCGRTGQLYQHAIEKRVIPVSPSTLHASMLVVLLGLRGLQIEQHAQEVMAYCAQLGKDFDRFRSDFEVVGKHIANAQSKYAEADRRLDRLGTSIERASGWDEAADEALGAVDPRRAIEAA